MAGVMRNDFTAAMEQDMYRWFWESFPEKTPVWAELFEVVPSRAAFEKFTSAIGLGELLQKPEREALQEEEPMESYTIVCSNFSFGRKVGFSYESVHDSQKGNLMEGTVRTWGPALDRTQEKFYAKFFNYGAYSAGHDVFDNALTGIVDDSSGKKIYDGQPFFASAHPDKVGNTYGNYTTTRALTHSNLETTYITYTTTNNRDERNYPIELTPDTLLIPPALKFTAAVILRTSLIPGSQDNDTNVLSNIVQPLEWSYLTDTDGWFLGKKKMGLMATDREGVSLDFWMDEETKDYYASIFARFGGCVTQWRYWYACNIATS